jgi:hypothetical protein
VGEEGEVGVTPAPHDVGIERVTVELALEQREACCHVTLLAEAAGTPKVIDDEAAKQVHSESGSNVAGWYTFQPLYEQITEAQPELLDE